MKVRAEVLDDVRAMLAGEPRIGLAHHPIHLDYAGGTLTVEGEMGSVAAKKLALLCAAGTEILIMRESDLLGVLDETR